MSIKRSRPKRVSQKDVPRLKRKLWSLLSPAIKARDGNSCVSCDRKGLDGSNWHAGHLFPAGSHSATRFHPYNIHSQDYRCNISLSGNAAEYASWFISKYGLWFFERMRDASRPTKQWKAWELEILIEKIRINLEEYSKYYEETYGPKLELSVVKK